MLDLGGDRTPKLTAPVKKVFMFTNDGPVQMYAFRVSLIKTT